MVKVSNGGDPLIGDYPYDQTFTFSSTGAVTSIPTNSAIVGYGSSSSSTSTSSSSSSSSGSGLGVGSTTSTAGVIPLQNSGTGSNVKLPTSTELDTLINAGDIVAIKQTVQKVVMSSLSCVAKTQYLNDLLGRISTFIVIKTSQLSQLQGILSTTLTQIANLKAQIANYSLSITNLGIPSLQNKLNDILNNLQIAYNAFNNGNVDLTPYNLNITANLQSINNLTNQKAEASNLLSNDKKSLNDTLTLITSLQQQLAAALNNKDLLSARILQQSNNISTITDQIDFLNADNVKLNNQINLINSNKTTLEASYRALETQAENVKSTITAYKAQQNQYEAQITTLNAQINQINANLDTTPQSNLNITISSLQSSIPSLQQQIDYVKFNCLGVVNYTVNTLNGAISYVFGSSSFSTYVSGQYGAPNSNTAQALLGPISQITLTPITIFNNVWTDLYGQPFAKDLSLVTSSNIAIPNFFISDFSCSSSLVLGSGNGVVKQISTNVITATLNDKSVVSLILGACSNVLVLNGLTPKLGTNIFWNGLKITSNTYQVYSALFI